jgi:tRNA (adenine57-N1/adenine58-N1)-methyltransferase
MYETLLRPHEVNQFPALPSVAMTSEKLKKSERKREEKRLRQIAQARAKHVEKRKRSDVDVDANANDGELDRKKTKTEGIDGCRTGDADMIVDPPLLVEAIVTATSAPEQHPAQSTSASVETSSGAAIEAPPLVVSRVVPEVRGHTSYLTFALLLPRFQSNTPAPATDASTQSVEYNKLSPASAELQSFAAKSVTDNC